MTIARMWKQHNPQSINGWMDKQNVCTEQWNLLSLRRKEILTHATTCGFPGGSVVKNLPASEGDTGDLGSTLGLRWSPGGRNGNPLHLFLPGKFHGQRSLAGYSPWGCKELDMTEQLSLHAPTGQGADTALKQEQSEFLPKEIGLSWHLDA